MIFGLGAALGWGLADIMVAIVARRIGSFSTLVMAQLAGIGVFSVLLAVGVFSLEPVGARAVILLALGVLGAVSYVAFYRALALGPIALVTPIVAGYAAIVIALSLVVGGESVPGVRLAGAFLAVGGVALASTDPRALRVRTDRAPTGLLFAIVAMSGFGVGAYLIGQYAKTDGWFTSLYLSRLGSAATLCVIALAMRLRRDRRDPGRTAALAPVVAVAALIGVLDILGFASFARGSEVGYISITAAASVTYPVIPIVGGVVYLKERPAPTQWLGVAIVLAGLVLLALGR